jgi:hypothetical protein
MASIEQLKRQIDLKDLADRLGIKQGKGGDDALYHSPHHPDKTPSLSIFINHPKHGNGWKDHSSGEGGTCIDLVMYAIGLTVSESMKWLHEAYAIPFDRQDGQAQPQKPKTLVDHIAARCIGARDQVREYLAGRGITEAAIAAALKASTVGFNEWVSPKVPEGEVGHGGPAAAFIVYAPGTRDVLGVDMRFFDPAINGDVKTQSQGEKDGYGWTSDWRRLERARRVYIVESAINALSIDSCELPGTAAFALRGLTNVQSIEWTFLKGKQVIICLDNDEPFEPGHRRAGERPGPNAAWALYEVLTAQNISAQLVDQSGWLKELDHEDSPSINDVNDYLQEHGVDLLRRALEQTEEWLIAGLAGDAKRKGKPRVYLPSHDYSQYWKYRVRPDFTRYITKMDKNRETDEEKPDYTDLCGFRVASLTRVSVASSASTMTGDTDHAPTVYFSATVQTARHGYQLTRKVFTDDQLHNIQQWSKFGPIWAPQQFSRMVNILERTADLGARTVANFVGLAWLNGQLAINEGPDCYFTDAEKQCPYHNLTFPSGPVQDAARVIRAYQGTFLKNAAAIPLVWALGGHLKALLGFWPHMTIQAGKSAGKSTIIKRLERTIAFTMFSGQSLQTEFRLMTSIAHTSHPVGWEELSARRQDVIDKAVGILQENYQYTITRRGTDMTEFLLSAPVLLAGEDVPVRSLTGKIVRSDLTGKKGALMPADLPRFPVRQWLTYLATLNKMDALAKYEELRDHLLARSRASGASQNDDGAGRMASNYAAVLLAWRYLADFAGMDYSEGSFGNDLVAEMNAHIAETSQDRAPWVWIMETFLSELDAGRFAHPNKFDIVDGKRCLLVRTSHIMDHLAHSPYLREKWNGSPVKSATVFKRQLAEAGVIEGKKDVERTIRGNRATHLTPLSLDALETFGLAAVERDDLHENSRSRP